MTNPVMIVTKTVDSFDNPIGQQCWVWCPGCDVQHAMNVKDAEGNHATPYWEWDGEMEQPTFNPSILVYASGSQPRCHSFITHGRWSYLTDCGHPLAGKSADMVPLPDWMVNP
jgi:hypothetical protein